MEHGVWGGGRSPPHKKLTDKQHKEKLSTVGKYFACSQEGYSKYLFACGVKISIQNSNLQTW